jgi:REP element-mobilizing transposase RayT
MSWRERFERGKEQHEPHAPMGWHARGYLPHLDDPDQIQSVNFRLADAMPQPLVDAWLEELKTLEEKDRRRELLRRVEKYLDAGHGSCALKMPEAARIVESALLFFHEDRYVLHAWTVMPNHVHVLFQPLPARRLGEILTSWKSFTSNKINRLLGREGRFWFPEYFDRFMRNEEHFWNEVAYIENNPVAAGLCRRPEDWTFSSSRRRIGN